MEVYKDYKVKIKILPPGLMHNRLDPEDFMQKKRRTKKAFYPEQEAEKRLYKDPDGRPYQPADHIEAAMAKAAVNWPYKGKKSFKDIVKGYVQVLPEKIPINRDWKVDVRIAKPPGQGRIPVARPVFEDVELEFTIRVWDPTLIDGETLEGILRDAGKLYGIGTFRPKFGRFVVTEFKEIKKERKLSS